MIGGFFRIHIVAGGIFRGAETAREVVPVSIEFSAPPKRPGRVEWVMVDDLGPADRDRCQNVQRHFRDDDR